MSAPPADAAIRTRAATVAYDDTVVVDNLDLDVLVGEWVALIGPNGAGKSTLLRALSGGVRATGDLDVTGADPRRLRHRERARRIAVVPQNPVVPPGMHVTDYVLLGRTPYLPYLGVESANDMAVVHDLLARLDLSQFAERQLGSLSGGELQRCVLARALAQEAPVLLLDEPTSALDIGHAQQVLELVAELREERGLTVLAAMHDLTTAGQFADRLVLLSAGHHVITGTAEEVLTEKLLARYYGARIRVLRHPDGGVVVVPTSKSTGGVRPSSGSARTQAR